MSKAHIFGIAVALSCIVSPAPAQFTAAVLPPKAPQKVDTIARADSIKRATLALTERVSDMKAWVDSAATALAAAPRPAAESTTALASAEHERVLETAAGEVEQSPAADTAFRNGAPAPNTATIVPLLALIGAGTLLLGVALVRR